eukprot:NODE_15644_length_1039_cov_2.793860.p1 GENE.NODE_15644_length_1039_cov_2.793860~~NODE_15644_length_1039_cov_2.793860.p1  ORF type:complete len:201 (+),score=25.57 NODE_15644_length_1039_cov_2.793860:109-711(+)
MLTSSASDTTLLGEEGGPKFPKGGPLWFSFYSLFPHVVFAVAQSSFSYIPYAGDSPAWLRAILFSNATLMGVVQHFPHYIEQACGLSIATLNHVYLLSTSILFAGLVAFICKICTILPTATSAALIGFVIAVLLLPLPMYLKVTGRKFPVTLSEHTNELTSGVYIVFHALVDGLAATFYVVSSILLGPQYVPGKLMSWLY